MLSKEYVSSEIIVPLIYRKYMKEQLDRLEELRNERIIYVTDLVSCSHKLKLRRLYPELSLRFEPGAVIGNLIHAGLEEILSEEGYQVEYPVERGFEVNGVEYILKGRVDAFHPEKKLVVEIKSSRDTQNKPHEHHVYQLQVYLNLLEVDKGILIYITPDGFLEYSVEREKINIKALIKTLVNDEIHPRWSWECRYCLFRRICSYAYVEK